MLKLSAQILTQVKSRVLKEVLLKIIKKINPKIARNIKALEIGLVLLRRRVEQALMLGYTKAIEWVKDWNYAFYLGITYLNTPFMYK